MRIAIVTREYPPETAWGGISSFYKNLATALSERGHSIEIFTQGIYQNHSYLDGNIRVHRVLACQNIDGPPTSGDRGGNSDLGDFAFSLSLELLKSFKKRHQEEPFNLVEGHEHLGVNAFINLYAPSDVVRITRYHTAYHSLVTRNLVTWPASSRISMLERESIENADYRIATSNFIDNISQHDFNAARAEATISNFAPTPPPFSGPCNERENLIIFAGRLILRHKRPDLAAAAFAQIANEIPLWRIEFAGPDMDLPEGGTTWAHCASILSKCPSDRYQYHGTLSAKEMRSLYERAKIIIIPSKFESFGMVALEAMHHGCVPIVSDETALADIVQDEALQFRNGDLQNLSAKLLRLIKDDHFLREKSEQSKNTAVIKYSPEAIINENIRIFESFGHKSISTSVHLSPVRKLPRISIVTPSFNQGKYIDETIQSVLTQNYPNFEHVVIDGGSTDETVSVLKKYSHIRWCSERDDGQTHAINKGILSTNGEIVAYLNSDDIYRPDAFKEVARIFSEEPDTQIIVGNCDVIDEQSKITAHYKAKAGNLESLVQYWGWDRLHCIPQQSVFFRRSLLTKIGLFDLRFDMVMDYQFWLRVVAAGHQFRVVDQTLAAFRIVPTTKTGGRTDEMYREEYQASSEFWPNIRWPARIRIARYARRHVAGKLLDMAEHFLLNTSAGRRPLRLLRESLLYSPLRLCSRRFVFTLVGALFKGPNKVSPLIAAKHRAYLNQVWQKSQKNAL
jgi:glycosyltransferase involved in cell wall biosynthesis